MTKQPFAIAGAGGGGKSGGGGSSTPREDPDSLQSQALARGIDLICEGPIVGLVDGPQSVFVDGTPLAGPNHLEEGEPQYNFSGISIATRLGTQDQTYIGAGPGEPAIPSVESETDVSVEITQASSATHQITDTGADSVRIRLGFPTLSEVDVSNGDTHGSTVQMRIDLQKSGGDFVAQPVGMAYSAMTLTGGYLVNGVAAKSFLVRVAYSRVHYDEDTPGDSHFTYAIQYRANGATDWITYEQKTIAPPSSHSSKSTATTVSTVTLPSSGIWNIRAVKISGAPSLKSFQGAAMVPSTTITVSGKTMSEYERAYTIPLEAGTGPWNVRVTRLTADSTTQYVQNASWWKSYTLVRNEKFTYPHSALVGFTVDSSQFSSIPTRAYDMKFLIVKVPSNYDPITRQYTGTWDGTFVLAWTDNPAWCFYDLATNNRYGLGKHIAAELLDKWFLYEIGRYCDELVPSGYLDDSGNAILEPRFTLNCYIQTRTEAYKLLNDLASVFRGMAYWAGGSIMVVQDSPADPEMMFTAANVVDGVFQYTSSSKRARHTVALVRWNDPTNMCKQAVEYVDDEEGIGRYGINQTETTAFGCISRGQARRFGKWILYSELNEREMVTFRTGFDGTYLRPLSVFGVSDPNRAGRRVGGRVVEATTTVVTLDAPVTIESGKTYTLSVILEDGSLEDRAVSNAAGSHTEIVVASAFSSAPAPDAIWVLKASDLTVTLWRALSITEPKKGILEIVGLSHYPGKFDLVEQGVKFAEIPTSYITPESHQILPPTGLTLAEEAYGIQGGVVAYRLVASWTPSVSTNVIGYQVSYRHVGDNWTTLPNQAMLSATIDNVQVGNYEVRVRALNDRGLYSAYETAEITVTHTGNGLPAIASPLFTTSRCTYTDKIQLVWSPVGSDALAYYEVRTDTNWGVDDSGLVYRGLATTFTMKPTGAASYTFHIKSYDRQGNFSITYDSITLTYTVPAPAFVSCEGGFRRVRIEWEPINDESYDVVEVWRAATNDRSGATKVGEIHSNVFVDASGLSISATYYYWLRTRSIFGTWSAWDTGDTAGHTATTSAINTADLADDLIQEALAAAGIVPPKVVSSLPALPDPLYPEGSQVYLTADGKLYRNRGGEGSPADEYADNLDRASLGAEYSTGNGFNPLSIESNQLRSSGGFGAAYRNDWEGGADQYVGMQLKTAGNPMSVSARCSPAGSAYEFYVVSNSFGAGKNIGIWKAVAGSGADVATGTAALAADDQIEIRVTGTNPVVIKAYINDVEVLSYSDNASDRLLDGAPGWAIYGTTARADNLAWGNFGTPDTGGWTAEVDGADLKANSVTAGQLAVGAVGADQVAANVIAAKHLVVADYTNAVVNPIYAGGDTSHWALSAGTGTVIAKGTSGVPSDAPTDYVCRLPASSYAGCPQGGSEYIDCSPGEEYYVSAECASDADVNGNITVGVQWLDKDGTYISNTAAATRSGVSAAWGKIGGILVAPATARRFVFLAQNHGTTGNWYFTQARVRKAAGGAMVVEGAITADKIATDQTLTQDLYLGGSEFHLDGPNKKMTVSSGGVERVSIGKYDGTNYGLRLRDASGNITLETGDTLQQEYMKVNKMGVIQNVCYPQWPFPQDDFSAWLSGTWDRVHFVGTRGDTNNLLWATTCPDGSYCQGGAIANPDILINSEYTLERGGICAVYLSDYKRLGVVCAYASGADGFIFKEINTTTKGVAIDTVNLSIGDGAGNYNYPSISKRSANTYYLWWINPTTGYLRVAAKLYNTSSGLYAAAQNLLSLSAYGAAASNWTIVGAFGASIFLYDSANKKVWRATLQGSTTFSLAYMVEFPASYPTGTIIDVAVYANAVGTGIASVQWCTASGDRIVAYATTNTAATIIGQGNTHVDGADRAVSCLFRTALGPLGVSSSADSLLVPYGRSMPRDPDATTGKRFAQFGLVNISSIANATLETCFQRTSMV
jgi:predicted phage tail protein